MAATTAPAMFGYELPLAAKDGPSAQEADTTASVYLPESLLGENVLWFCRLRWTVIAILLAFGTLGLVPGLLHRMGLRCHPHWPFAAAAVLTAANLAFLAHARLIARSPAAHRVTANLWAQIVVDLVVLTVVVHYMGSLETYVAFAYLFHIVLACIFFPGTLSLGVTAIACALYIGCVALEEARVLPLAGIYNNTALRDQIHRVAGARLVNVSWAVLTWAVVWYLTSHLSALVRARDNELAQTNQHLVEAQEERRRHMLRTTHELKAPFSAIHANVQLLLKGHCGGIPQDAQDTLRRIAARCGRLAAEIQEMLQLANLQSTTQRPLPRVEIDLADVLRWCIARIEAQARERDIHFDVDLRAARTLAVEDHLKMLFSNLLANAVAYSYPGGGVAVRCAPTPGSGSTVVIEDHGIGIPREKLPRIFDAYYRTNEATRHNRDSTGLGLSIVRHVAQTHGIRIRVHSEPGVGTTFISELPPATHSHGPQRDGKETDSGLSDDRG